MKSTAKIAIFVYDFKSLTGLAIAIGTRSIFTHAAVQVNGEWWDSSEYRGDFNRMDEQRYSTRPCIILEVPGDPQDWLEGHKGAKYDWLGIFGWFTWWALGRRIDKLLKTEKVNQLLKKNRFTQWIGKYINKIFYVESETEFFCFETGIAMLEALGYELPEKPYSGQSIITSTQIPGLFGSFKDIKNLSINH